MASRRGKMVVSRLQVSRLTMFIDQSLENFCAKVLIVVIVRSFHTVHDPRLAYSRNRCQSRTLVPSRARDGPLGKAVRPFLVGSYLPGGGEAWMGSKKTPPP